MRCSVYGCDSYRENKVSMFSLPSDKVGQDLWNDILKHPRKELGRQHAVCEKHFRPEDVIKHVRINEMMLPYKKPRLRKGCLPLAPTYHASASAKKLDTQDVIVQIKREVTDDQSDDDNKLCLKNETHQVGSNSIEAQLDIKEDVAVDTKIKRECVDDQFDEFEKKNAFLRNALWFPVTHQASSTLTEDVAVNRKTRRDDQLNYEKPCLRKRLRRQEGSSSIKRRVDVEVTVDADVKIEYNSVEFDPVKSECEYSDVKCGSLSGSFFDALYDSHDFPGLTQHWGVHACEPYTPPVKPCMVDLLDLNKPRSVIFSQTNIRDGVPIFEKQVVLHEDYRIDYFVGYHKVNVALPTTCASPDELCMAINEYATFKVCVGGPSCTDYEELILVTNCSFKDMSSRTWRHRKCSYFTQDAASQCWYCQAIPKYFKKFMKSSTMLKKWKKLNSGEDKWVDATQS